MSDSALRSSMSILFASNCWGRASDGCMRSVILVKDTSNPDLKIRKDFSDVSLLVLVPEWLASYLTW